MIINLPGNMSLRLTGGLFVSSVILWVAFFTGMHGLTTSCKGKRTEVWTTRGAPETDDSQSNEFSISTAKDSLQVVLTGNSLLL